MSMIDRYKKKGGFIQLLILLETTGNEKREKFLKLIAEENPTWEAEIKKKMLSLDRICGWNQSYLMEIFPRMPGNALAAIISGLPAEKQATFLGAMSFQERKKAEDFLKEKKPTSGEINSSVMKLMSEIRNMVASGELKFEKFDPDMAIPDNIEDQLSGGGSGGGSAGSVSTKQLEASFTPPPAGAPQALVDELNLLRKKLLQLNQENQKLTTENAQMKSKLDQIKKIA